MGVRDEQKQATRERVLEAARDLFNETGYEETTIRAIAERAGVSVGSVFTTFASKAEVLSHVMERRLGDLYAEFDRVLPFLRGSTADRLCSIFAIHYEFETKRVRLFLAHIAASYSPSNDPGVTPYGRNERLSDMLEQVLRDGVARGDVRGDLDLPLTVEVLKACYASNYRMAAARGADAAEMSTAMDRQVALIAAGWAPRS
ncbi:TetR family transcriptional regulator [Caulobacter flavus]|uniref:TetR family transcriptional regulator n=1 Tax=Caulobacter flavus TaxID=1679497 RepID=A0A2N5CV01_9CAUL|nr:TetR/AcrR family transcriptional regulator [Caulobacter flavus]AYV45393.1 TetR family transcriptional regulator [Caulobacter flavus]PLR17625.1 TetR family transcriptional regulator [Caulobacter flavus]